MVRDEDEIIPDGRAEPSVGAVIDRGWVVTLAGLGPSTLRRVVDVAGPALEAETRGSGSVVRRP